MITVVLLTAFIMNFTSVGAKFMPLAGTANQPVASALGAETATFRLWLYGIDVWCCGVVQSWTVMTVAPDSLLGYELQYWLRWCLAALVCSAGAARYRYFARRGVVGSDAKRAKFIGVSSYWQTLITGIIIVASIRPRRGVSIRTGVCYEKIVA